MSIPDLDRHKAHILEEIEERRQYLRELDGIREKFGRVLDADYVYAKMLEQKKHGEAPITTGISWWDLWQGGFRRGNSYVLAGYPGVGKTTLAINLAWGVARTKKVWYYCLELSSSEVFEVLAGHIVGKAVLKEEDFTYAYSAIKPSGFRFFETEKYLTWDQHLDLMAKEVRKAGIDFLIIDNLSFLTRVAKNTYEVENVTSARIKTLAQELEIPILLIHHLRKPGEDGGEPEPTAHTMRGSGAIMADASDAYILHHPIDPSGDQTRMPVGYVLSGKPRWGKGGKLHLRLTGEARTYHYAVASDYRGGKRLRRGYPDE